MNKLKLFIMVSLFSIMGMQAQERKILVAYFSCTGNTERVAKAIAQATSGTLYRITPQKAYTSADLDWRNSQSRSNKEMNDEKTRPALADKAAKAGTYDIVFLGYPIWWDKCPRIIQTFIESYPLNGKKIVPFATSGSSSITNSITMLSRYDNIVWQPGKLLNSGTANAARWAKQVIQTISKN